MTSENFEATQWAVEEFKCRGLKRLFKPVTSWENCACVFFETARIEAQQFDQRR